MSERDDDDADVIEACARMCAWGAPVPDLYYSLVNGLIEKRGGWRGSTPVGNIADNTLDQIFARATVLRGELFGMALEATAMPATRH